MSGHHRPRPAPSGGMPDDPHHVPDLPAVQHPVGQRSCVDDGELVGHTVGIGAVEDGRWCAGQKRPIRVHRCAQRRPQGHGALHVNPNQTGHAQGAGAGVTLAEQQQKPVVDGVHRLDVAPPAGTARYRILIRSDQQQLVRITARHRHGEQDLAVGGAVADRRIADLGRGAVQVAVVDPVPATDPAPSRMRPHAPGPDCRRVVENLPGKCVLGDVAVGVETDDQGAAHGRPAAGRCRVRHGAGDHTGAQRWRWDVGQVQHAHLAIAVSVVRVTPAKKRGAVVTSR